jgi:hypothetical protein
MSSSEFKKIKLIEYPRLYLANCKAALDSPSEKEFSEISEKQQGTDKFNVIILRNAGRHSYPD